MSTPNLDLLLDNPVWHTLSGQHASLAGRNGPLLWYPADHAPFVSVADGATRVSSARGLVGKRYFLGPVPTQDMRLWTTTAVSPVLQMIRLAGTALPSPANTAVVLDENDRPAMNALTAVAFPDFFRAQTASLGTYVGIKVDGTVVSMAGERMTVPGAREISGVCTAPGHTGNGFGRDVMLALMARHEAQGIASFLHVSESNAVAIRLYERLGFRPRAVLALHAVDFPV